MKCHAFTSSEQTIVNRIKTSIMLFDRFISQDLSQIKKWIAIWDTGATTTCITSNVAKELNLIPTGTVKTSTAGGAKECNTYCVDVLLPNNILIQNLTVYEVYLNDGDVLVGMDILRHGDFSITNHNGKTKMSFRIPSIESIDFVEDINNHKQTITTTDI